jgi:acyl-CoA synthetase (AMP-forming)/AMP-acid ligase II
LYAEAEFLRIGATTILPGTLRSAIKDLGADRASEAYGMTETGPCIMHRFSHLTSTIPPVTTSGVPRGTPGELHCGGLPIIKEYWLGAEKRGHEAFYDDEEGRWIRTGDRAVMDGNGEVRIVGRYKDMIIRGGENISPSAIESILLSHFDLTAEIVALPDTDRRCEEEERSTGRRFQSSRIAG